MHVDQCGRDRNPEVNQLGGEEQAAVGIFESARLGIARAENGRRARCSRKWLMVFIAALHVPVATASAGA
jgi:hypothetical protein